MPVTDWSHDADARHIYAAIEDALIPVLARLMPDYNVTKVGFVTTDEAFSPAPDKVQVRIHLQRHGARMPRTDTLSERVTHAEAMWQQHQQDKLRFIQEMDREPQRLRVEPDGALVHPVTGARIWPNGRPDPYMHGPTVYPTQPSWWDRFKAWAVGWRSD